MFKKIVLGMQNEQKLFYPTSSPYLWLPVLLRAFLEPPYAGRSPDVLLLQEACGVRQPLGAPAADPVTDAGRADGAAGREGQGGR